MSPLDIWNQALLSIGAQSTVASMTEQSAAANYCRLYYDDTRQAMLRAAYWNFARYSNYLTLLKALPGTPENPTDGSTNWQPSYPPVPWLYEYALPSGCLAMRYITPQWLGGGGIAPTIFPDGYGLGYNYFDAPSQNPALNSVPFLVAIDTDNEGQRRQVVLTNLTQAVGVWTTDIEEVSLWDASFKQAMISALAVRLCIPVSGKQELAKEASKAALQTIREAQARDGNEGTTNTNFTPDWIRVRGGYAWGSPNGVFTPGWVMPGFLYV